MFKERSMQLFCLLLSLLNIICPCEDFSVSFLDDGYVSSQESQLIISTPVVTDGCWLKTKIESSSSFELVEIKDDDNCTIPLNSLQITMDWSYKADVHQLFISLCMKKRPATFQLRFRHLNHPFSTWKCRLSCQPHENFSSVEREDISVGTTRDFYVQNRYVINILLIGRSQVGKSTLIESLTNPTYSSSKTGISQTREPTYKQLTIKSDNGEECTVNIIDTPGLREIRNDPNETRTDEQLLHLLKKVFDDGRIRALNMIGFVSVMGKTYQNDIDTFKSLIDFFGPRFKSISALILTHCDKVSNERIQQLTDELKTHPKCAEVVKYCELGVHHHGTLDIDDLETYTPDLRERMRQLTLSHLAPMRAELMKFIQSRSQHCVELFEGKSNGTSFWRKILDDYNEHMLNHHVQSCVVL